MPTSYEDIMNAIDYSTTLTGGDGSGTGGLQDFLGNLGLLGGLAQGIGGTAALTSAYNRLGSIGETAQQGALGIGQAGLDQSKFQPFSVTSATGGQFGYDPTTGAATMAGSPQERAIQSMLMGQAQSTFGATPYGQAGGRAAAEQAYGLGGQFMRAAQTQPGDINALRGMFANQAASALGGGGQAVAQGPFSFASPVNASWDKTRVQEMFPQPQIDPNLVQPSPGFSQETMRKISEQNAANSVSLTMPNGSTMKVNPNDPRLQGLSESQMIQKIMAPQAPSIGQLGQQALGLGSQGLATQAPSDVEALRQQYAGLAGQSAGNVLGSTAGREADVYNRIRATQRPEEERQRMALEERLFNQGRSGVSTNMYGGTPEQLAMAKAQEESQNSASLAAIQQAQAEQQQALGMAETFGGMFGQQAGLSSDVQTQAQARAAQLSTLGLSANQIESQLQTEGLGRAVTSSGQSAALAKLAGDLQAQQAGLGLGMSELGSMLSAQDMALLSAQQDLGMGALAGSYVPQSQLLAAMQGSELYPQLQQRGQLYGAGLFGEASMGGLEALLGSGLGQANLMGQLGTGLISGLATPTDNYGGLSDVIGAGTNIYEKLFGKDGLFG